VTEVPYGGCDSVQWIQYLIGAFLWNFGSSSCACRVCAHVNKPVEVFPLFESDLDSDSTESSVGTRYIKSVH
jgi:hypothetical protein